MARHLPSPVTAFALLLAACSDDARPPANRNTGEGTGALGAGGTIVRDAGPQCTQMGVLCDGQTPYRCTASGGRQYQAACQGATPFCAPGVGCLACLPESLRCSPADANVPQRCSPDGSRWVDQSACDAAMNQRCSDGRCGDPCSAADGVRPYLGCEYWATQTPNSQLDPAFPFAVALGNPQSFAVEVQILGGGLAEPMTLTLAPGDVRTVTLPWVRELVQLDPDYRGCAVGDRNCGAREPARSAVARNGAYRVTATAPVAAYQFNPLTFERMANGRRYASFSNDASLLLSRRALTQRYLVLTAPNWRPARDVVLGGFIAVTAVAGETTSVTVRLPPTHGVEEAEGDVVRHDNLMPGDVALIVGRDTGDLSGALVEASAPVAVFVGHDCTNVPQSRPACDHLEEQLLPLETLGRDYVVSGLHDRNVESVVRVVSPYEALLRFEPESLYPPVRLNPREVFQITTRQSFRVSASRPVLTAQFMVGQGGVGELAGDPAMVQEVPAQQFRDRYDLLVPDTYTNNFLALVVPRGASPLLDDMPVGGEAERLGPWDVVHTRVSPGRHRLRTAQGAPLGVKVYGTAQYTSYMYPGGLDLRLLPPG